MSWFRGLVALLAPNEKISDETDYSDEGYGDDDEELDGRVKVAPWEESSLTIKKKKDILTMYPSEKWMKNNKMHFVILLLQYMMECLGAIPASQQM
jgi:hypothetical protein